jgi:hypothetical protein
MAVWEDHLLPLLTGKDAARLGTTCKALREVVRENFTDVGRIDWECFTAALITFPRVRTMGIAISDTDQQGQDVEALVQWMREGGRGRYLQRVTHYRDRVDFFQEALRGGALPLLRNLIARLQFPTHRALFTERLLAAMHELRVYINMGGDALSMEPQFAALGLVRQLPALARLEVHFRGSIDDPGEWPPFIPPSLRSLRIEWSFSQAGPPVESFLCALSGMLAASGARLDRLEIMIPGRLSNGGEGLVHVAQALRCWSPTLKGFLLSTADSASLGVYGDAEDDEDQVEQLHVHFTEVMAAVSACRELEVLVLPPIEVEPLFPPGTAFARLTHLEISYHEREDSPDAGVMGLWELMASGGLPALAKLSVRLEGWGGGVEEVRSRVAPALEAVAGTLRHLHLDSNESQLWLDDGVEVGYELGVAVGKLRRLKDLALSLSEDRAFYQSLRQGLAASGGERPLPLLWRVAVQVEPETSAEVVKSLLLSSVRVFITCLDSSGAAVLTACALRRARYEYTWALRSSERNRVPQSTLSAIVPCRIVRQSLFDSRPPWAIWPLGYLPFGE